MVARTISARRIAATPRLGLMRLSFLIGRPIIFAWDGDVKRSSASRTRGFEAVEWRSAIGKRRSLRRRYRETVLSGAIRRRCCGAGGRGDRGGAGAAALGRALGFEPLELDRRMV